MFGFSRNQAQLATPAITPSEQPEACVKCGEPYPEYLSSDAKRRIEELEAQVRILTEKASAAADKLADYEDELRRSRQNQASTSSPPRPDPRRTSGSPSESSTTSSVAGRPQPYTSSRFASVLSFGRTSPAPAPIPEAAPSPREAELAAQLTREQDLRKKAEGKLSSMDNELEELSAQLFQQANEMVATERRARAKLEERVKVLESREEEKRRRLERLEKAVRRVERVKGLLNAG